LGLHQREHKKGEQQASMLLLQHLLRRAPAAACTVLTASYTQARAQQAPLQCDDGVDNDEDDDKFEGPRRHTLADPNRYDSIVIGCGVSGTAAVEAVAKHADRGHRCLVLESDAFAVRRCEALSAEVGSDIIDCVRARAESLNPLLRQVRTTHGDEYSYAKKCLVATGAAAAVPPPGFVDELCVESVRCLGHGEAADAAAVRDAFSVAKRGGRVCVVGGSWQAVALAAAVARAAPAETAGDSASLVFPEATPIGARLPKARRPRPLAWTFVCLHAIEPTRPRGQRRFDGVELPRHRTDAATEARRVSARVTPSTRLCPHRTWARS
jgi:hypothetical protein